MKNGLTKTLATIAIACLGFQAFASAPVVREMPSPVIVDDANPVTGSYIFVYADFLSGPNGLNAYVTDDGPVANIVWSFVGASGVPGDYQINGALGLDLGGGDDPVTPPAGKVVSSTATLTAASEFTTDNNILTPTIRDRSLSPIVGGDPATTGTTVGSTPGEIVNTDVLTLFASDGTTVGARELLVFTVAGDPAGDHLSATQEPTPENVYSTNFATAGASGWVQGAVVGNTTYSTAGGICAAVTLTGANIAEWVSPYGTIIQLVDNAIWRIRATMSSNQTTLGSTPLWDIRIENFRSDAGGADPTGGTELAYGSDFMFLDNTGSANRIGSSPGLTQFDLWFTPAASATPQFRDPTTGAFTAARDAINDARIVYRIIDVDGAGYLGEQDAGTLCITNLVVDRFDLDDQFSPTQVYNLNPMTQGISGVTAADLIGSATDGSGSNKDFSTAPLTLTPSSAAGWLTELTLIDPGDTTNPPPSDAAYGDGTAGLDNYPITWEPNVLYKVSVVASAPSAAAETNGPDALRLSYDARTIELLGEAYALTGMGQVGMPKQVSTVGSTQTFAQYFWSHNASLTTVPNGNRLRWRVGVFNTTNYDHGSPVQPRNPGGIRIHSVKVEKVQFFGM
jgi:hypothetical protein